MYGIRARGQDLNKALRRLDHDLSIPLECRLLDWPEHTGDPNPWWARSSLMTALTSLQQPVAFDAAPSRQDKCVFVRQ